MVVRDVRTRWNYTHAMICHALLMQAVSDVAALLDHVGCSCVELFYRLSMTGFTRVSLRGAAISPADWKFLKEIADFLEVRIHCHPAVYKII